MKVWVVVYTSYHDGDFSNSGVKGVFSSEAAAEKVKKELNESSYMEAFVTSMKVQD